MGTLFRWYNFVSQYDFYWFIISLSKYHAYCFAGGNVKPLSTAHASSLLVTPCRALAATLWFLVVMYISRSSANSDSSTTFPNSSNIPLIATRKGVTLRTPPCGIPKSIYLLCETNPPTLTLIHLSPINYLMNLNILPCIPKFSSCSNVLSLLTMS